MRLRVLGPLVVDGDHNGLSPRDRTILTALTVCRGEPVDSDVLAQVLWGEDAPASRAKVVQGCVMRLRRRLGAESIQTTTHGYRIALAADEIDAERFVALVTKSRDLIELGDHDRAAHTLAQALGLWRGRPLVDAPDWDRARIEAMRLYDVRQEAEELAVVADLGRGRLSDAVTVAAARVAEAPLRERRWELLARAQYATGRQVEAIRTLQRARTYLAEEAGVDPGPGLTALEDAVLAQDPSLLVVTPPPEPSEVCPYLGMVPYDQDDAEVFFGRDREIEACLRQLSETGVLAVVGASGTGKSSIIRAGLVPALRRQGRRVTVITPGTSPTRSLPGATPDDPPVLVVDQCEEVVTLGSSNESRARFLDAVVAHAAGAPVVVVLRADLLGELARHRPFSRLLEQGMYLLGPMGEPELREAIERPAEEAGLLIEAGLVELLLREAEGEPSALPLLSHCLRQTWERREGRTLTVHGYLESGGIKGAVAQTAESMFAGLDADGQGVLRSVVLRMVTLDPEGDPIVGPVSRRALPADERHRAALESMIGHRLFTSDGELVEISHEALVRAWPRLRSWLDDDVEGARILRHLAVSAETWDAMGRPDSELYRGARLVAALDWQERARPGLGDSESQFLVESRRLRDREEADRAEQVSRQARANRYLRILLAGAVALLVVALATGGLFLREADKAAEAAVIAEARRLSSLAQVARDADLSLLMAVEAVGMADTNDTRSSLLQVILRNPELLATSRTRAAATDLAVTRGGHVVVADFLDDVAVHAADGLEQDPNLEWPGVEGRAAQRLGVRPGSGELAVGARYWTPSGTPHIGEDPPVVFLDPATLDLAALQLGGMPDRAGAFALSFSADGRYGMAGFSVFEDAELSHEVVMVWDLDSPGTPIFEVEAGLVHEAALGADGSRLHIVTDEGYRILDVATGATLGEVEPPDSWGLVLSGDGRWLATAEGDGLLLVDAESLERGTVDVVYRLSGFDSVVQDFRFSHDSTLVAAGDGESIRIWNTGDGRLVHRLEGPERLTRLAFAPDDRTLFAVGNNGVLTSHDLTGDRGFVRRAAGIAWDRQFVAIVSPDGSRVAFASNPDGNGALHVSVVELSSGSTVVVDPGHGLWGDITWSPDSRRLATAGADGFVRVWESATLALQFERDLGVGHLAGIDWSDDGSVLMAAARSGEVTVLDSTDLGTVLRGRIPGGRVLWASLAPDNRTVAASFGTPELVVMVVDLESGRVLHRVPFGASVWQVEFSPDGATLLVGGGSGDVGFFDLERGTWKAPPQAAHKDAVFAAFAADGSMAVTGGWDGQVVLWDATTGSRLASVRIGPLITVPSFHPDGTTVLIPYDDGSIYTWDTRVDSWIDHACRVAGRTFTADEWSAIVGDVPHRQTCVSAGVDPIGS